ncbi:MAG: hypothetical protein HZB43_03290 [candidate division Zixibacteria bacterium]|nr:hypothetical protein [candidate division Zixibacteria bacterium]
MEAKTDDQIFGRHETPIRRLLLDIFIILAILFVFAQPVAAQSSHAALDWATPYRWVHVDHIAPERTVVFESARHGWLAALKQGDSLLADGRPLFWELRGKDHSTFYTLYPFARFGELDARREAALSTQRIVGKEALDRYDSADSVLIPPHYSQIWRRSPDFDYVPSGVDSLTEKIAPCGWIEFQTPDFFRGDECDSLWKEIAGALTAEHYPLTCRSFWNVYGDGELIRMWLAPDSATLMAAPSVKDVVAHHFGADRMRNIFDRLDKVLPTTVSQSSRRRTDMSNLGR